MRLPRFLRPRVHVRRCVHCGERLRGNGMRLYEVGTVCPACWLLIRGWHKAIRAALDDALTHDTTTDRPDRKAA